MRSLKSKLPNTTYLPIRNETVDVIERCKIDALNKSSSFKSSFYYDEYFDIDRTLTDDEN
jgi:hypothetical protein